MNKLIIVFLLLYPLTSLHRTKQNMTNKKTLPRTTKNNNIKNMYFNKARNKKPNKKNNNDIHFIGPWHEGFFVSFHSVLNHVSWCDKQNKIPVVCWDQRFRYFVPEGFNNAYNNAWEYYFEPVSSQQSMSPEITPYMYAATHNEPCEFEFYFMDQETRDRAFYLISKYIKLKPIVQKKIDDFYNRNMKGKKTIGIHMRGTDKGIEEQLFDPQEVITQALKYADSSTQFLIATDDERLMNRMKDLLQGRKIIYYNCYRSKNGSPLHKAIHPQSRAQAGEDVLIEVILLSKCDLLIHTLSYVSTTALYFNPHLRHVVVRQKGLPTNYKDIKIQHDKFKYYYVPSHAICSQFMRYP